MTDEAKDKTADLLSAKERNRHLKRHIEMERLFGADFLPISKDAQRAKLEPKGDGSQLEANRAQNP